MTITSFTQLEAALPPVRYSGNPIAVSRTGDWKDSQVFDPVAFNDPLDPTKIIILCSGLFYPPGTGEMCIGGFEAFKASPLVWTEFGSNPVLRGTPGEWDWCPEGQTAALPGVRMGNVVEQAGIFYLFYCGGTGWLGGTTGFKIGVATSTDGRVFTKYAGNPIITLSDGEVSLEDPSVIFDNGVWYLYYSYQEAGNILPSVRVATALSPLGPWTKYRVGGDLVSILNTGRLEGKPDIAATYDYRQIEWHQIFKLGDDFVLVYECYSGGNTSGQCSISDEDDIPYSDKTACELNGGVWTLPEASYQIALASSNNPLGPFTKSTHNPILTRSEVVGAFDRYQVATGGIYFINNQPYLFYCGSMDDVEFYGYSHWDMGAALIGDGAPGALQFAIQPTIQSTAFDGGTIAYSTADPDNRQYTLDVSTDNGDSWNFIRNESPGDYTVTLGPLEPGSYQVKLRASPPTGDTTPVVSEAVELAVGSVTLTAMAKSALASLSVTAITGTRLASIQCGQRNAVATTGATGVLGTKLAIIQPAAFAALSTISASIITGISLTSGSASVVAQSKIALATISGCFAAGAENASIQALTLSLTASALPAIITGTTIAAVSAIPFTATATITTAAVAGMESSAGGIRGPTNNIIRIVDHAGQPITIIYV